MSNKNRRKPRRVKTPEREQNHLAVMVALYGMTGMQTITLDDG